MTSYARRHRVLFLARGRLAELLPDGMHPNTTAHRLLAERLKGIISP